MSYLSGLSDYDDMYHNEVIADYAIRLTRATRVACELSKLLKKDATLYSKISPRTKRWIKKHEEIDKKREEEKDKAIRIARRRIKALSKLSDKEKELLGLPVDKPTDD